MYDAFRFDAFLRDHTLVAKTLVDPLALRDDSRLKHHEHQVDHKHSMMLAHEIHKKFKTVWTGDGHLVHYKTEVIVVTAAELAEFIRNEVSERLIYQNALKF